MIRMISPEAWNDTNKHVIQRHLLFNVSSLACLGRTYIGFSL